MKLSLAQNPVTTSDNFTRTAFSIGDTSKIFKIMIDLYSNKPLAVVRELVCNAFDTGAKFKVSTPTHLDPTFSVRDFGPGMSHEFMTGGYTSVGHSTKDGDDLSIGGFGLGRMAALAYCDKYSVTSIHDGMKRIYDVFRAEGNVPQVVLLTEARTGFPSGVEVKVPIKASDYGTFKDRCEKVLRFFPKDRFEAFGFMAARPEMSAETPLWALLANPPQRHYSSRGHGGHEALLGPVAYPLDWAQVPGGDVLPSAIIPIFQVGELDLPPSREGLSYDAQTVKNLQERRALITAELCERAYAKVMTLGPVARLQFREQLESAELGEMFKQYQISKGTWKAGAYSANNGYGNFFERKDECVTLQGGFREYEVGRANTVTQKFRLCSGLTFNRSNQILNSQFVFHDMSDDRAPRLTDRIQTLSVHKSGMLYVISPTKNIPDLAALKQLLPDAPPDIFHNLSDLYVAPKVNKPRSVSMNLYFYHAGSTQQLKDTRLVTSGLYVEYTASEPEVQAEELIALKVHEQPVYGLTKKARSMLDMSQFVHLRDYVHSHIQARLDDPNWVRAYQAHQTYFGLSSEDLNLFHKLASATLPELQAYKQTCQALLADGPDHQHDFDVVFKMNKAPPSLDRHGVARQIRQFRATYPTLNFILGLTNSVRFDGPHNDHLKELLK